MLSVKPSSQYDASPHDAMQRNALRHRVIVTRNRLFSILRDVVRLVAVGGDDMQSYIAVLANFGMTSHCVAGALQRLASYCELGLKQ